MRTLVVSDLHLGGSSGAAVLQRQPAREALFATLAEVERLVLLGDLLELRHGPRGQALASARPFLRELGHAFAGREVIVLAGNHDYALIEEWRRRRDEAAASGDETAGEQATVYGDKTARDGHRGSTQPLALEQRMPAAHASAMLAAIAEWMAPARVSAAYPGVWLREDVYATHGHYLDCHLSVPTMECLGLGMTARALGRRTSELGCVADYEAVSAPVYAWIDAVARQAPTGSTLNGQSTVRMWRALGGDRDSTRRGASAHRRASERSEGTSERPEGAGEGEGRDGALDGAPSGPDGSSSGIAGLAALGPLVRRRALVGAFPVAVAALNRLGLGAFRADISAPELRRAGLRAMGEVTGRLGLGEAHVIFGHTHRAGPTARDDAAEWLAPSGARLHNTGCWTYDAYFLRGGPGQSPYWPGGAVLVEESGPPRLLRLLDSFAAEELAPAPE